MEVIINGTQCRLEPSTTLDALIDSLELHDKFAVEINQCIISQGNYQTTQIQDGDNIEIIHAIGGG